MSNETLIHSFTKRRSRLVQFARRLLGEASDKTTPLRPSTIWPKVLPPPTAPVLHATWDFGSAEKENNYELTIKVPADLEIGFTTAVGGPTDLKFLMDESYKNLHAIGRIGTFYFTDCVLSLPLRLN